MNDIYILNILLESMSKKSFKPSKKVFFVALLLLLIASGITASLLDKKNNYVLSLKQVQHSLVSIPPQPIDSKNNLKPVYTKGLLTTSDSIRDEQLGISLNALALHRKVYMYQWKEKTAVNSNESSALNDLGDSFSYERVWSDHLNDSTKFHMQHGHINPKEMPLKSVKIYAPHISIGDFVLLSIAGSIINYKKIDLSDLDINALQTSTHKHLNFVAVDDMICSGVVEKPQIGDICIELYAAKPQKVSIIAQQNEQTLQPFLAQAGQRIFIVATGEHSADELIHSAIAQYQNNSLFSSVREIIRADTGF